MALIKCSECGQIVSDKASACPHCGCPVNQTTQPQYFGDEQEEKPNNALKWLLGVLAALVVLGGAALFAWQNGMFNKTVTLEDTVAVDSTLTMAAPVIELDGDGMFSIDDCPTTYEGLEIVKHQGEYNLSSIDVIFDGKQLCSFAFRNDDDNLDNNDYVTGDQVHYLDANFDGYVDFFIGPCEDRNYSALFIWDQEQSTFVRVRQDGDPQFNGNYQFHPSSRKVYFSGSGCAVCHHAVRLSWQGNDLRSEEALTSVMSKSYIDENQPARYVIRKGLEGKIIFSTDDPNKIPAQWKKWAYIPTAEEAKQYEEDDEEWGADGDPGEEYNNDIEEVKSWIQGNWRYRMVSELGAMECRVGINGDDIVVMYNGEVQYSGPYTIEGDDIIYKRGNGWSEGIRIDREHKRLMANESEPMRRM